MTTILREYFPMLRTKEEILSEISEKAELRSVYQKWNEEQQQRFLDYCTGQKGVRILYDPFFKEIMNPEINPGRVEELISLILKQKVKILYVLPLESPRIGDEHSLVVMDLVVKLEDGSIVNIEVQKLGYRFPGQRSACYSADLLLRQYKRVRGEKGTSFSYRDIKKVYTIVLYEKSTLEFHRFPDQYIHHFSQQSDTGIKIDLLQEYVFIPLDIYRKILQNETINSKLEAWLTFLSADEPEMIRKLILSYPQFEKYYEEIYELCRNTEKVMDMFSKELYELDKNTVQYMIDEMQEELDQKKKILEEQSGKIEEQAEKIEEQQKLLAQREEEIRELKRQMECLSAK